MEEAFQDTDEQEIRHDYEGLTVVVEAQMTQLEENLVAEKAIRKKKSIVGNPNWVGT